MRAAGVRDSVAVYRSTRYSRDKESMGKGKQAAKQASSSGRSKITGEKKQGECEKESTEGGGDGGMEERPTKVVGRDAKRSSTKEASDGKRILSVFTVYE